MRAKDEVRRELGDFLGQYSESLGPPGERNKDDEEGWIFAKVFNNLIPSDKRAGSFVTHRENPDFLLEVGRFQIGVEVTEAIGQFTAKRRNHFARCVEEGEQPVVRLYSDFHPAHVEGWSDESYFELFNEIVAPLIRAKIKKAQSYQRLDRMWLVIYGNLHAVGPAASQAIEQLRPRIEDREKQAFDCAILLMNGSSYALWGDPNLFAQ